MPRGELTEVHDVLSQLVAIGIFVLVFAVATLRGIHLGVIMFPAACGVGVWLGAMPLDDVMQGFPISIMVLLVGVTYFFAIAQTNGTIDRLIERALGRVGESAAFLPLVFFALSAGIAAMGSPLAALVLAPVAMQLGRRYGIDLMLMAIAIAAGQSAGGFAPTSLFGIVTYGTARDAGIAFNPLALFAAAAVCNLVLLSAAWGIFRGKSLARIEVPIASDAQRPTEPVDLRSNARFTRAQVITVVCICGLIFVVITSSLMGLTPDVGLICLAFGVGLALVNPTVGMSAVARIDWSTVLLVGGIITFVGVLQHMGAVELLGETAANIGAPIPTAIGICLIAGLVSAFASTTGILAALVPLAVPLATSGQMSGWALVTALALCASIVDVCPFSTTGATLVATAPEQERPRMISRLTLWGMSMVLIGPVVLVACLLLPGAL
jgi:di/tricarboxylate transporter